MRPDLQRGKQMNFAPPLFVNEKNRKMRPYPQRRKIDFAPPPYLLKKKMGWNAPLPAKKKKNFATILFKEQKREKCCPTYKEKNRVLPRHNLLKKNTRKCAPTHKEEK